MLFRKLIVYIFLSALSLFLRIMGELSSSLLLEGEPRHDFSRQELCDLTEGDNLHDGQELEDYLIYAALNNPELESAFNRWKAQLEKVVQEKTLPDPRFNYAYYIRSVETRVGPQKQMFSLMQVFPWFGKLRLRGKAALEAADSALQDYETVKLKLFYNVKNLYYEFYYLGRSVFTTKENWQLLQSFERISRSKYEAGTAPFSDVIKAQTELDRLEDRLKTLLDLKDPLLAKFNAALNLPYKTGHPWPKTLSIVRLELNDMALAAYLNSENPELKSLDYLAEKEKTGIELAKKDYFPDITLGLDYIDTGKAKPMYNCCTGQYMPVSGSGKPAILFKFSCNLPIWQKKYNAGQQEAEKKYLAAMEMRAGRRNTLDADMKQALFKYRDASRKIALYRDALIPKAKLSLQATQKDYEAGKTDFLNLIDAQRVLLELQLTYEKAVAEHAQALAGIEMITGKEFGR